MFYLLLFPEINWTLFCSHAAQVAGGGGSSNHGQVEIFSLNRAAPRLVKTVPLRATVLCLEYVKEPCPSTVKKEADKPQSPVKIGNIICVGLQDGRSVCSCKVILHTDAVIFHLLCEQIKQLQHVIW